MSLDKTYRPLRTGPGRIFGVFLEARLDTTGSVMGAGDLIVQVDSVALGMGIPSPVATSASPCLS